MKKISSLLLSSLALIPTALAFVVPGAQRSPGSSFSTYALVILIILIILIIISYLILSMKKKKGKRK